MLSELMVSQDPLPGKKIEQQRQNRGLIDLSLIYLPGLYIKLSDGSNKVEIGVQEPNSTVVPHIKVNRNSAGLVISSIFLIAFLQSLTIVKQVKLRLTMSLPP